MWAEEGVQVYEAYQVKKREGDKLRCLIIRIFFHGFFLYCGTHYKSNFPDSDSLLQCAHPGCTDFVNQVVSEMVLVCFMCVMVLVCTCM